MKARIRFPAVLSLLVLAMLAAGPAFAQKAVITFLHLNDLYEISPKEGRGGCASLATLLKQERAKAQYSFITLGGDLIGSSMMSGITKGVQMIELSNAMGMDIAVAGNHEFDFGPEIFKQRIAESKFPWLGTNVLGADGKIVAPMVGEVLRKAGDFTIGFFGLITAETGHLSSPGPDIRFGPILDTARDAVKRLRDQGADMVVALTHLDIAQDRELARLVKGIDVILGGHDHDPITFYEGGVFIFKVGHDAHYLGVAQIEIEKTQSQQGPKVTIWPRGWQMVTTVGVAPDPEVAAIVKKYDDQLNASLNVPVGTTTVALDSRRATVRLKEAAIGNMISDAIREFAKADVAITNGGGIRGDKTYDAGATLTRRDVLTELPFGNLATVTEIKGADLREALESGVSQVEDTAGRFPQVSGLRFTFDRKLPKGSRVVEVSVGGKPLDPAATYRVATNEFMMNGGDGYAALTKGKVVVDASGGTLLATVVMDYLQAKGTVAPAVEGRIVERQ